jgi:allophanate hydrolase
MTLRAVPGLPAVLDLATVRDLYATGNFTPLELLTALMARIDGADPAAFITRTPIERIRADIGDLLARAAEVNSLPLWGVPFAVKDNIDVGGLPTTAACPAFEHIPVGDAAVVARLKAAGAIVIGKTNLDQLATGINGSRSPYGAPRSVFSPDHISGGSSSGSAVAVAAGLCSFALGTDTAGSGRVPAAFNNLVGIKPTPGLLSTSGVLPACRSLDCVTIFALNVADGAAVRRLAEGFDPADAYSRRATLLPLPSVGLRIGVLPPADREFFGDDEVARLYDAAISAAAALGDIVEIDFAPFRETATLLYDGPWVAERLAAFEGFGLPITALDPSVAIITLGGAGRTATDAFRGLYALEALKRRAEAEWAKADLLLLPTAPTIYRVDAMLADPIRLNSRLGTYTNFFNLLGMSGIAIPAGFRSDGLPAGVTLAGRGFQDDALVPIADALHRLIGRGAGRDRTERGYPPLPTPPAGETIDLVVVGAHLSGMALNHELLTLGATLKAAARTTADYRLFVLPDTVPAKPGLIRVPGFAGPGIAVEIWSLDPAAFGRFVAKIPGPLGIGKVRLDDGSQVSGFLCESLALVDAPEITGFGGWRAYVASQIAG